MTLLHLHLHLDHGPRSAQTARRAVRAHVLARWPEAADDERLLSLLEDAELVTSELVGNAVRHGEPPLVLDVEAGEQVDGPRLVTITCSDAGPWDGSPPNPSSGRGLVIVRALVRDLRIEGDATSTTVVATLAR